MPNEGNDTSFSDFRDYYIRLYSKSQISLGVCDNEVIQICFSVSN